MARASFIYDRELGELLPKAEWHAKYGPNSRAGSGLQVIGDVAPYISQQTGEVIGGRRQHREHLRQHGLIEVGNEKVSGRREPITPGGLREDIQRAMER